ncbi:Cytochrome c551 peroxidase [Labilithrix luteola]|uniref:Cytochrome c551 peroxidase n=1 Tax=Labilithrix luteola TaxID=1391654 RepID=A0A0K1PVG6_9BACT|nr:Cytochrome c551 peroxidase [Labilithrix luteola]
MVDVLVRDDDGSPASEADLATWQERQDQKTIVALDANARFVVPQTALPRILVVDPRTMRIRADLASPGPEFLAEEVARAVADVDGVAAPTSNEPTKVDGRFDRMQWDMMRGMFLGSGGPPKDPTNRVADDVPAAALGKLLFADQSLSPSGLVSCEGCHEPSRTFADNAETATRGIGGVERNTPSVVLSAWSRWQFWDGRADSLWMQALGPFEAPAEFGSSRLFVAHRIHDVYKDAYEPIFGPLPDLADTLRYPPSGGPGASAYDAMPESDRDAVTAVFVNVGKAIAAYERSFRTYGTALDSYRSGYADALTDSQKDGLLAFFTTGCAQCHWGPRLTDDAFHVVRFPTGHHDGSADPGRSEGRAAYESSEFRVDGRWSDSPAPPRRVVHDGELGAFKTPPLRGVVLTGPYGHGGSVPLLRMAVDLHRTLGMPQGSTMTTGDVDPCLVPFDAARVDAITSFLGTLGLGFSSTL